MICSICNCRLTSEDTHTITISNGVDDRKYIHNHFILCPTCYSNFKYKLEVAGTPIEGPEDRDDIKCLMMLSAIVLILLLDTSITIPMIDVKTRKNHAL